MPVVPLDISGRAPTVRRMAPFLAVFGVVPAPSSGRDGSATGTRFTEATTGPQITHLAVVRSQMSHRQGRAM
jgi:hypothetical protein